MAASRQTYVGTLGSLLVFLDALIRSSDQKARQWEETGEYDPETDKPVLKAVFNPEPWDDGGVEESTLVLLDAIFAQAEANPALSPHPSQKRTYRGLLKAAEPYRA